MKRKSLKIDQFEVKSFVTNIEKVRLHGGLNYANDIKDNTQWRDCSYINCQDTF
jgi:hypothetical protein